MTQRETYVALSRHKDESHIYVNLAEINERVRTFEDGIEPNDVLRQKVLAELMKQDRHSSLAVEYLEKREQKMALLAPCRGPSISECDLDTTL
jgi:hypothetical protein